MRQQVVGRADFIEGDIGRISQPGPISYFEVREPGIARHVGREAFVAAIRHKADSRADAGVLAAEMQQRPIPVAAVRRIPVGKPPGLYREHLKVFLQQHFVSTHAQRRLDGSGGAVAIIGAEARPQPHPLRQVAHIQMHVHRRRRKRPFRRDGRSRGPLGVGLERVEAEHHPSRHTRPGTCSSLRFLRLNRLIRNLALRRYLGERFRLDLRRRWGLLPRRNRRLHLKLRSARHCKWLTGKRRHAPVRDAADDGQRPGEHPVPIGRQGITGQNALITTGVQVDVLTGHVGHPRRHPSLLRIRRRSGARQRQPYRRHRYVNVAILLHRSDGMNSRRSTHRRSRARRRARRPYPAGCARGR